MQKQKTINSIAAGTDVSDDSWPTGKNSPSVKRVQRGGERESGRVGLADGHMIAAAGEAG